METNARRFEMRGEAVMAAATAGAAVGVEF